VLDIGELACTHWAGATGPIWPLMTASLLAGLGSITALKISLFFRSSKNLSQLMAGKGQRFKM